MTCEVLDQARAGERKAAKAAFLDRAHEPIHDLGEATAPCPEP